MLSGRGLCDGPIPHLAESCRLCCVVCELETSRMRRTSSQTLNLCSFIRLSDELHDERKLKIVVLFVSVLTLVNKTGKGEIIFRHSESGGRYP